MNLNSNNNYPKNYIHFPQPNFFNSSPPENEENIDFEQRYQKLQKRINKYKKMHNQKKEEQENYELNRNIANFYKNPFQYMEYLAKNYFIQNANTLENMKIKKEMTDNFRRLCYQIEDHIQKFTENEEIKLKKLQKDLEDKLKGNMLPLSNEEKNSNSNSINNNRNFDQKNFDEKKNKIISSPVNMNDEELMRRIFGNNSYNQSPLDGIITTGNANNFVNNNKMSNLNEDNLYLNALSCLKGDKMVAPKNKFIAVKELNLNDINQRKIVDTQNLIDLKNQMNIEQKMQLYNKNKENQIKNKIHQNKKEEKKNLEELISYSNNYIKNMEKYQKEKEVLLEELKNKLNKEFAENANKLALQKISINEKNLNEMKEKYNKPPENKICNWEEKKDLLEKEFMDTQNMVNNFLNGTKGVKLKNQNKKMNNKMKGKKKRNNSALPYKNSRFYNYNP